MAPAVSVPAAVRMVIGIAAMSLIAAGLGSSNWTQFTVQQTSYYATISPHYYDINLPGGLNAQGTWTSDVGVILCSLLSSGCGAEVAALGLMSAAVSLCVIGLAIDFLTLVCRVACSARHTSCLLTMSTICFFLSGVAAALAGYIWNGFVNSFSSYINGINEFQLIIITSNTEAGYGLALAGAVLAIITSFTHCKVNRANTDPSVMMIFNNPVAQTSSQNVQVNMQNVVVANPTMPAPTYGYYPGAAPIMPPPGQPYMGPPAGQPYAVPSYGMPMGAPMEQKEPQPFVYSQSNDYAPGYSPYSSEAQQLI